MKQNSENPVSPQNSTKHDEVLSNQVVSLEELLRLPAKRVIKAEILPDEGTDETSAEKNLKNANKSRSFAVHHRTKSRFKNIGKILVIPLVLAGMFLSLLLILHGVIWFSDKTLEWLIGASEWVFEIDVLILLPLCIFKKTRLFAGRCFALSSYVFLAMVFAGSFLSLDAAWGRSGVIIGIFFLTVPPALIAEILHHEWGGLLLLIIGVVMTIGAHLIGKHFARKN